MAPLTLTILGASPAAPNPGGACSGYLLREGETAVLMDCGAGTAGRIAQHVAPNHLQGVAISHLHPDHYFDLIMCESAMLEAAQDEANPALRGHMSAAEAGSAAKQAGAKRLLITHYRSSPKYDGHHLATASATFGGPVELAHEGQTYVVG